VYTDQQGIKLHSANAKGAELYTKVLDEFMTFKSSVFETMDAAIVENPEFAMPYFTKAYLNLFLTERRFRDIAKKTMDELRENVDVGALTPVELAHLAAVDAWNDGDLRKSAKILDRLGVEEPREVLCFRVGHELDYFNGDTRNLRDRVARHLSAWNDDDHHIGIVHGCYAFGLEENGHYERAEEFGYRALLEDPEDVWALHAVAHTYEMRGMLGEGIRFMEERNEDWALDNLFVAHNAWHKSLFHVDQQDYQSALKIYDSVLFNDDSAKVTFVLLDAASLLWRIYLDGGDVGDRFGPLASMWSELLPDKPYYVFNEMHATMAQVGAGHIGEAEKIVKRMEDYVTSADEASDNYRNCQRVGLPVCKAILAFAQEKYDDTVDCLYEVRAYANEFGGSAAQRDVLDRTLVEAAIRAKRADMAAAMTSERVNIKPMSPYNWIKAAQAFQLNGAREKAVSAKDRAGKLVKTAVSAAQGKKPAAVVN